MLLMRFNAYIVNDTMPCICQYCNVHTIHILTYQFFAHSASNSVYPWNYANGSRFFVSWFNGERVYRYRHVYIIGTEILIRMPGDNYHIEAETKLVPFPNDIFKSIFLKGNVWISIKISQKFVPKGPINNIPALVQIMVWRRLGDKSLSETMMVSLLMHICVTRPQRVIQPWSISVNNSQGSTDIDHVVITKRQNITKSCGYYGIFRICSHHGCAVDGQSKRILHSYWASSTGEFDE